MSVNRKPASRRTCRDHLNTKQVATPLSFDWGVYSASGSFSGVGATISVTDIGANNTISYDAFGSGNDNGFAGNSVENSARLSFPFLFGAGFDPNVDNSYRVTLSVSGLTGGTQSFSADAQMGAGAVPEPASWALMLGGFGMIGGAMRSRRKAAVSFG